MTMGWNSGLEDGWRHYESDFHNCIFYNSILRNNNPYDDDELEDLTEYLGGLYVLPKCRSSQNILIVVKDLFLK